MPTIPMPLYRRGLVVLVIPHSEVCQMAGDSVFAGGYVLGDSSYPL